MHGRCATKFLTGAIPRPFGQEGNDFHADVSMDQMWRKELGRDTQLASLELSLESGDVGAGTCDGGYSCTYTHTICVAQPDHAAADGAQPARRCSSGCSATAGARIPRRGWRGWRRTAASSTR